MSFRIGDVVYGVNGKPGIVVKSDRIAGEVEVDTKRQEVRDTHKHGYINGLTPKERTDYNSYLDDVSEKEDPQEKISSIRGKINELKEDPKQVKMVKYLESELFHIMNTHNVEPRFYSIDTPKAPVGKA